MGRTKEVTNIKGRHKGKFVSSKVVQQALEAAAAGDRDGDGTHQQEQAGELDQAPTIQLDQIVVAPQPKPPRSARHPVNPHAAAKIVRFQNSYASERKRSSALASRIKVLEGQVADANAARDAAESKAREERLDHGAELRLVKLRLRNAQFASASAKAEAARKANEAAQRVRDKAATTRKLDREKHLQQLAKQTERDRLDREAARDVANREIERLNDQAREAKREKLELEKGVLAEKKKQDADNNRLNGKLQQQQGKFQKQKEAMKQKAKAAGKEQLEKQEAKYLKELEEAKEKARLALVSKPIQTCVPPLCHTPAGHRKRYDYIRRQSERLRAFFESSWSDGPDGETALEVFTYYLDHHTPFATKVFVELGIPKEIEAQVIRALEEWFTVEKAVTLRNITGMTWEGYRHFSGSLFCNRDAVTGKYVPITMPFGGKPLQAPRTWRLMDFEKQIYLAFGLQETDDGITAWCEVIPLLELRLNAVPAEAFPDKGDLLKIFFGADAFRLYAENSTKAVLCVAKPMIQRTDAEGHRLQGWAINSAMNNVKMAIFEGGDSYAELCTKGSQVQKQLMKLKTTGLMIHQEKRAIRLGIFGDMSFINNILGSGGCSTHNCCPKCDCRKHQLLWTAQEFKDAKQAAPKPMTILRRTKLSHAFGEEYGLTKPYKCEGCDKIISKHLQYAPKNQNQEKVHMNSHFSQKHGRPPLQQCDTKDVCTCSMHGEHNLIAQCFYATFTQNLWDKKTTDEVAAVVNEEWGMKRHTIKQQTGKSPITKDTPHFNGPEGKKVLAGMPEAVDRHRPQDTRGQGQGRGALAGLGGPLCHLADSRA